MLDEPISDNPHPFMASSPASKRADHKPALLFVHGAWHGAWCWQEHFFAHFNAVGHDCHAIDLSGHGKSPSTRQLRFTGIGTYVKDIETAVSRIDRPLIIIGHSMGGFTLQHYLAEDRPIQAAILLASVPWYGAIVPTMQIAMRHPLTFLKANLTLSLKPMIENRELAAALMFSGRLDQKTLDHYLDQLQDESWLAYIQMVLAKLPLFAKTNVPMLVVGAQEDALFSPASQQALARRYDADFVCIPELGHDMMIDNHWKRAADAVTTWLAQLPEITPVR